MDWRIKLCKNVVIRLFKLMVWEVVVGEWMFEIEMVRVLFV